MNFTIQLNDSEYAYHPSEQLKNFMEEWDTDEITFIENPTQIKVTIRRKR
jgi:hypothetical protein